jgi:SAM-dependent methyltransferase
MSVVDHVRRNREIWDGWAADYEEQGRRAWASDERHWGIWHIPERTIGVVPDVAGRDVVELGCGTAYWSAWFARRGARPVGIDNSAAQLRTAGALQRTHGLAFPLVHASAEAVPLAAERFDLAFTEYGASTWCDPHRWIPEAARLLRPGGELIFMKNSTLLTLCLPDEGPAGDRLARDLFGLHRLEWTDDHSIGFNLSWGDWIRLFRRNHLAVEDLIELRPPVDATSGRYDFVTLAWARRWPSEEIWRVRKEP